MSKVIIILSLHKQYSQLNFNAKNMKYVGEKCSNMTLE